MKKLALNSVAEELFRGDDDDSFQSADSFNQEARSHGGDLRQSSRYIEAQKPEQSGFFSRMWQKLRGKNKKTSAETSLELNKNDQPLLSGDQNAGFNESNSNSTTDGMLAPLPEYLTFTNKQSNTEVSEWLCLDQLTSPERVLNCF